MILRCSASERGGTAEFDSRLIGIREVLRDQHSRSNSTLFSKAESTRTVMEHHVTEDAVMASEREQLLDLTGFLKDASAGRYISGTSHKLANWERASTLTRSRS